MRVGGSPTVMMKGSVLTISRMKDTRTTCSQMLPWGPKGASELVEDRDGARAAEVRCGRSGAGSGDSLCS